MTREEFISDVTTWGELIEFAQDNGLDELVYDIVDESIINDEVNEFLPDLVREENWTVVLEYLDSIPRDWGTYIRTGYLEYEEATDQYFERLKDDILDEMDDLELWDEYVDDDGEESEDCVGDEFDVGSTMMALFGAKAS